MPVLQPSEYDASYFDGGRQSLRHNAGYEYYERWFRFEGEGSRGEWFKDLAARLAGQRNLSNRKVLELGCAKGFFVEDLRELGIDAWGVDVSPYAIGEASEAVQPFLSVGDARTYLAQFNPNFWDVVFSLRFLVCLSEDELPSLITQMNRVSRAQFHVIDEQPNPEFYLARPLSWWRELGWARGTVLVSQETFQEVTK